MHFSALNPQYPTGRQLHGYLDFKLNKTNVGRYEYILFTAILPPTAIACFWDFGDGTTSNQATPLKNYTTQGQYTVKLIAIDANGNTSSVSKRSLVSVNNAITQFPFDAGYTGMSGTPNGVYSFRQYLSGVNYCVNLRRSTDNAQKDFGFTDQGYLDTSSISVWAGPAQVYVTKWYDQSGVADANQTNQSLQPQLIIPASGYVYLSCSGTYLIINNNPIFGPARAFTINMIAGSASGTDTTYYPLFQYGASSGAWVYTAIGCSSGKQTLRCSYSSGSGNTIITSALLESFTTMSSITLSHNTSSKLFVNHSGALQTPSSGFLANSDLVNSGTSIGQIGSSSSTLVHFVWEAIMVNNTFDYGYIYNSQKGFYTNIN